LNRITAGKSDIETSEIIGSKMIIIDHKRFDFIRRDAEEIFRIADFSNDGCQSWPKRLMIDLDRGNVYIGN
jgi:hypothetical protein